MKPEKFLENPFLSELSKVVTKSIETRVDEIEVEIEPIFNGTTGEISNTAFTAIKKELKNVTYKSNFIKVMVDNIHVLTELNSAGTKMMYITMIAMRLESMNKDYCYLSPESAKALGETIGIKMSGPLFYKGVAEMIDVGLIAKSTHTTRYWLNVGVLFNGEFSKLESMKRLDPIYFAENMMRKTLKGKV